MEDKKLKLERAVRDMIEGAKMSEVETKYGINAGTLSTLKKGAEIAMKLKLESNEVETEVESCNCDTVISFPADCKNCKEDNRKELITALLEVTDLRAEIENLRARASEMPAEKEIIEKIVEVEKDCTSCEKIAAMDMEKADLRAEMQAKDQGLQEKEKYIQQLKSSLSSLQTETEKVSRLESALKQLETKNNSLKAEVEAGKAETSRLQSVVENTKKELSEALDATGIPVWLIFIGVLAVVAFFFIGTWL
jgi:chromosome segregation ATPase